jgi:hypothetical protein
LLDKLRVETVASLSQEIRDLNRQGIYTVEHRKCNFDVEIGRDLVMDYLASPNLSLGKHGLRIYDIQKIRDFICRAKEMNFPS